MDHLSDEELSEVPSLLMLDDDCLREIFLLLELDVFVNFASTCSRLRNVGINAKKYKNIAVQAGNGDVEQNISQEQFRNVLSVIGNHVLAVELYEANQLILESIRECCKNIESSKLWCDDESLQLQYFRNLKELKVTDVDNDTDVRVSINDWKMFFESNATLESLDYHHGDYDDGFIELLLMLPELKYLGLPWLPEFFHHQAEFQHLLRLQGLKKLSIRSEYNCNEILIEVAKCIPLVELDIEMAFDENSLEIMKSFERLEVLSMHHWNWQKTWFSVTVLPPNLKRIKFGIPLSCSTFLAMVKRLNYLEEVDVGYSGVFLDGDESIHLKDLRVRSRIEDELKRNQRTLKIFYFDWETKDLLYIHNSHQLKIINSECAGEQARARRISVS